MSGADDYPLVVCRIGDQYRVEASSLGLVRTGSDLHALEGEVREAAAEILAVCRRHGAKFTLPEASQTAYADGNRYFGTIRWTMMIVLAIVGFSTPLVWAAEAVKNVFVSSMQQLDTKNVPAAITSAINRTADTLEMITPERREQLSHDFARIARALEPYAAEMRPLWLPAEPKRRGTGRDDPSQ